MKNVPQRQACQAAAASAEGKDVTEGNKDDKADPKDAKDCIFCGGTGRKGFSPCTWCAAGKKIAASEAAARTEALPTNSGLEAAGSESDQKRAEIAPKGSAKDDYERRVREDYVLSHTREPEHWIKGEGGGKVLNPAWKLWERRRRKGRRVDGFGDLISAPVRLKELSGNVTLNGRTGSMLTFDPTENMYVVELDEPAELDGIDRVKVPPEHLDPLNATAQRRMAYNATTPCARSVRALNACTRPLRACCVSSGDLCGPSTLGPLFGFLVFASLVLSGPLERLLSSRQEWIGPTTCTFTAPMEFGTRVGSRKSGLTWTDYTVYTFNAPVSFYVDGRRVSAVAHRWPSKWMGDRHMSSMYDWWLSIGGTGSVDETEHTVSDKHQTITFHRRENYEFTTPIGGHVDCWYMRTDEQAVKLDGTVIDHNGLGALVILFGLLSLIPLSVFLFICGKECESCQREWTTLEEYDEDGRLPMSHAVNARVNCCCRWCIGCGRCALRLPYAASPTADEATAMEAAVPRATPPSQNSQSALPLRRIAGFCLGLLLSFCAMSPDLLGTIAPAGSAALVALMWIGVSLLVACYAGILHALCRAWAKSPCLLMTLGPVGFLLWYGLIIKARIRFEAADLFVLDEATGERDQTAWDPFIFVQRYSVLVFGLVCLVIFVYGSAQLCGCCSDLPSVLCGGCLLAMFLAFCWVMPNPKDVSADRTPWVIFYIVVIGPSCCMRCWQCCASPRDADNYERMSA